MYKTKKEFLKLLDENISENAIIEFTLSIEEPVASFSPLARKSSMKILDSCTNTTTMIVSWKDTWRPETPIVVDDY